MEIDDLTLEQIEELINKGDSVTMPEEYVNYLKWMEMARDWWYKMKSKEFIVKHLRMQVRVETGKDLSVFRANKVFSDAMNFFYASKTIRKDAYRQMYAEKLEVAAQLAFEMNQLETYGSLIEKAAKLRQLDKEDLVTEDMKLLERRPIFYSTKAKEFGLETNKNQLAEFIDTLDMKEVDKVRVKRDAGVTEDRKLFEE